MGQDSTEDQCSWSASWGATICSDALAEVWWWCPCRTCSPMPYCLSSSASHACRSDTISENCFSKTWARARASCPTLDRSTSRDAWCASCNSRCFPCSVRANEAKNLMQSGRSLRAGSSHNSLWVAVTLSSKLCCQAACSDFMRAMSASSRACRSSGVLKETSACASASFASSGAQTLWSWCLGSSHITRNKALISCSTEFSTVGRCSSELPDAKAGLVEEACLPRWLGSAAILASMLPCNCCRSWPQRVSDPRSDRLLVMRSACCSNCSCISARSRWRRTTPSSSPRSPSGASATECGAR
mmetsp:Transcript_17655/g.48815  ORF Transcript_17655/g.48815 Transcript_17655/m.48815 type:complete len:301 (-) Transcript_17655:578-1480(-)